MRVSPKTYYGYSGRFKDNVGKKQTQPKSFGGRHVRKFAECSCTKMILLENKVFVEHQDNFGIICDGSGQPKDFWKF